MSSLCADKHAYFSFFFCLESQKKGENFHTYLNFLSGFYCLEWRCSCFGWRWILWLRRHIQKLHGHFGGFREGLHTWVTKLLCCQKRKENVGPPYTYSLLCVFGWPTNEYLPTRGQLSRCPCFALTIMTGWMELSKNRCWLQASSGFRDSLPSLRDRMLSDLWLTSIHMKPLSL